MGNGISEGFDLTMDEITGVEVQLGEKRKED